MHSSAEAHTRILDFILTIFFPCTSTASQLSHFTCLAELPLFKVPFSFSLKTISQSPQRKASMTNSLSLGGDAMVKMGVSFYGSSTKISYLLVVTIFPSCHFKSMNSESCTKCFSTLWAYTLNLKSSPLIALVANRSPLGEKIRVLVLEKGQISVMSSPLESNPSNFGKSPPR